MLIQYVKEVSELFEHVFIITKILDDKSVYYEDIFGKLDTFCCFV